MIDPRAIAGAGFAPEHIAGPAMTALDRLFTGVGTIQDLHAYRAWIIWCRLHGDDDAMLAHAVKTAEKYARKLGVE